MEESGASCGRRLPNRPPLVLPYSLTHTQAQNERVLSHTNRRGKITRVRCTNANLRFWEGFVVGVQRRGPRARSASVRAQRLVRVALDCRHRIAARNNSSASCNSRQFTSHVREHNYQLERVHWFCLHKNDWCSQTVRPGNFEWKWIAPEKSRACFMCGHWMVLFCLFFNNISRFLMVLRFFVFHFQHGVSQSFMLRCVCPDTYRCCSRRIAGIFRNPMSCLYTVSIACLHTSTARIVSRKIMILPKYVSCTPANLYAQQRHSLCRFFSI